MFFSDKSHNLKKLIFLPYTLVIFVIAIFLVLVIRLLSPLIVVRSAPLDIARIGGYYHSDLYLSEKKCGRYQSKYLDIFYFMKSTQHINHQWKEMWEREINVFIFPKLARFTEKLNERLPGYEKFQIPNSDFMLSRKEYKDYMTGEDLTIYEKYNKYLKTVLSVSQPNLSFTLEEIKRGNTLLQKLGIPVNTPFICFHNRDSAFLDAVKSDYDWSYHDYRDSTIEKYLRAADEMTDRGCYSIRVGSITKEKVNNSNPALIDYANSEKRSDFLDIYLSARCKFFICSNTGMSFPAEVFNRPLVYVNWTDLLRLPVYALNGLIIFKKLYLKNENRYLSVQEIINFDFSVFNNNEISSNLGIELIENTPEEICSVTIEMDDRLNGNWKSTNEDEKLQKRFWDLFGADHLKSKNLRIGADYLKQNKQLLG